MVISQRGREKTSLSGLLNCVPYLKFNLSIVDLDHASSEFDADGKVVDWLESLVSEL